MEPLEKKLRFGTSYAWLAYVHAWIGEFGLIDHLLSLTSSFASLGSYEFSMLVQALSESDRE